MANISITSVCNHSCPYCFASNTNAKGSSGFFMSREIFTKILSFLYSSGIKELSIIGGEPTLHPEFFHFVDLILEKFDSLRIFTNGDMPSEVIDYLSKIAPRRVSVIVNLTDCVTIEKQSKFLRKTLKILGTKVMAGVTIHRPDTPLSFLLPLIKKFGLKKRIRVGLAHPAPKGDNSFLLPKTYSAVGLKILDFARKADQEGVRLSLDCGFVPCMFGAEDTSLLERSDTPIGCYCGVIPDILCDASIIPCYPCASLAEILLSQVDDLHSAKKKLAKKLVPYKEVGIFRECGECVLWVAGKCFGGCRGGAVRRLEPAGFTVDVKAVFENRDQISKSWSIPYIDQPIEFWNNLKRQYGAHIREVYLPLSLAGVGSGRPVQPERYMDDFITSSVFPVSILINPIVLRQPVEEVIPGLLKTLGQVVETGRVVSVTVANASLAARIKENFPKLHLVASVLMDISSPTQVPMLSDYFSTIVVSSRIMRSLPALEALRSAWGGQLRMIVNEGCLPGCIFRTQHFYEMSSNILYPQSLCSKMLKENPWLRLTGSWVLPQHLYFFDDLIDDYKLDGRVTLKNPEQYNQVLGAYIGRKDFYPHNIGGGPASLNKPLKISDAFYRHTLLCSKDCASCSVCLNYLEGEWE